MPQLRPAQAEILTYERGYMAVSAVPGSGKTFTLTQLATKLIANGTINPTNGQEILIVTYLNASVDTFKARIRKQLLEMGLPPVGFDVRTLHSLGLEIMRQTGGVLDSSGSDHFNVTDEVQSNHFLGQAIDNWIENHKEAWAQFLPTESPQDRSKWRDATERMAKSFIRTAKNERYRVGNITTQLHQQDSQTNQYPLVWMLNGIYAQYQTILNRQGVVDFDDLIWQATEEIVRRPDLAASLRYRWPYVLEDEAQDSVPLQEVLLTALTGENGNWVRVGDPNQAVTSTFTAAHPRYLKRFIERSDVRSCPLPNSGRCAPIIIGAANAIVHWVVAHHSVPEVRHETFLEQDILPTPEGDAQPNPSPVGKGINIAVYKQQEEEELPEVAKLAARYLQKYPDHTAAILVPTHAVGHKVAPHLELLKVPYDNLLRGGTNERKVTAAVYGTLALLANPLDAKSLVGVHRALSEIKHPAALPADSPEPEMRRFNAILQGVNRLEELLYPQNGGGVEQSLPAQVARPEDVARVQKLTEFLRYLFRLRPLPIDDLVMALSDQLFVQLETADPEKRFTEPDLALAYQLAMKMRSWRDAQPDWRLPELAEQLEEYARGYKALNLTNAKEDGYEPEAGRITLCTQHASKGLEWDAVFLVGVDARWIPNSLEGYFQGKLDLLGDANPEAEVNAQLRFLMAGSAGIYPNRTATESAHIDIICERLRLLYVGITRAKRYLQLSRSRATRRQGMEQPSEPTTVMQVLYNYLKQG